MGWPGEQLLGMLWVTLAEKGIGLSLKPRQMRREGVVALELERAKKLVEAQSERDAEDIRTGKKDLTDFSLKLGFSEGRLTQGVDDSRIEPTIYVERALTVGRAQEDDEVLRRQINVEKSISYAEDVLRGDGSAAPEERVDGDWIYRWRDCAKDVSSDELQKIWGNLLAGELKAPGTYSLRLLDFVRNLSQSEALLIESLSSLVIDEMVWNPEEEGVLPIGFGKLLELEELGILTGVSSTGLTARLRNMTDEPSFTKILMCHDKLIILRHEDGGSVFNFKAYPVTRLGKQVISLGKFKADSDYLMKCARKIKGLGCQVYVADYVGRDDGYMIWNNEVEVTLE